MYWAPNTDWGNKLFALGVLAGKTSELAYSSLIMKHINSQNLMGVFFIEIYDFQVAGT